MYFSEYEWSINGLKKFLHNEDNTIQSIYEENKCVLLDVNTYQDCNMLLGNGEMNNMCYSNINEFWNRYLYSQTRNCPNKHIVILDFKKKRSEEESHISIIFKKDVSNNYKMDRCLTNLHNYTFNLPIKEETIMKNINKIRYAEAIPIIITHDELVKKHIEFFGK